MSQVYKLVSIGWFISELVVLSRGSYFPGLIWITKVLFIFLFCFTFTAGANCQINKRNNIESDNPFLLLLLLSL